MDQPKISVVIPTYRRPKLLFDCLTALTCQRLSAELFEVIVVSDGYDEETEATVKMFSSAVVKFIYKYLLKKSGPAAARNLGWRSARGRLIAFTDDDCQPDEDWLKAFTESYKGETAIAYSGSIKVPLPARPTDFARNTAGLEGARFVTANCCCTKAALETVGGFDERFFMAWREDSDLEFKLLQHRIPVQKLTAALIVHPVRMAAWGVSIKEQKKGMFNALLYKKFPLLYRARIQAQPPWNYYIMVGCIVLLLIGFLCKSLFLAAIAIFVWLFFLVGFIGKRLKQTSHSRSHVAEMIVTSMVIPFASVYWQLYGAYKYRVWFL